MEKETKTGPTKRSQRERGNTEIHRNGVHNIYLDSYQRQNSKRVDL